MCIVLFGATLIVMLFTDVFLHAWLEEAFGEFSLFGQVRRYWYMTTWMALIAMGSLSLCLQACCLQELRKKEVRAFHTTREAVGLGGDLEQLLSTTAAANTSHSTSCERVNV